jgi:hypothetical protein
MALNMEYKVPAWEWTWLVDPVDTVSMSNKGPKMARSPATTFKIGEKSVLRFLSQLCVIFRADSFGSIDICTFSGPLWPILLEMAVFQQN